MPEIAGHLICAWVVWDGCKRAKRRRELERMVATITRLREAIESYKADVTYEWRPR